MLGEIAALAELTAAARKGWAALKRLQPEYGTFWKSFEKELKPQAYDLPWKKLEQLRLNPEFVGEACGLIRGDHEKRKAMRKRIAALAVPPKGGRYDAEEIVEIVMIAARDSANRAAREDREATLQGDRLIEGLLEDEFRELIKRMDRVEKKIDGLGPEPTVGPKRKPVTRPKARDTAPPSGKPSGGAMDEAQRAESAFAELIQSDPKVTAALESWSLPATKLRYQPDFVLKDHEGTNWVVEVKGESALRRPKVRDQVRRLAALTEEAGQTLPEEWRYAVVTPSTLESSDSWADIRSALEENDWLK